MGLGDVQRRARARAKVCYARVSSAHQRPDLQRQIEYLQAQKPGYEIISDVGSGLNWNRRGYRALLERVHAGDIEEVVVTFKDRMCRFGFELVEWIFRKADTRIVVLSQSAPAESAAEQQHELAEDLLAVTNFFVARNNGRRAAQFRRERKERERATEEEGAQVADGPQEHKTGNSQEKTRGTGDQNASVKRKRPAQETEISSKSHRTKASSQHPARVSAQDIQDAAVPHERTSQCCFANGSGRRGGPITSASLPSITICAQ